MTDDELRHLDIRKLLDGIKAPTTIDAYARHWAVYATFAGPVGPMADADTLLAWRQHLIENTREAANTINLRLHSVQSIFRELAERRQIAPAIHWAMRDVKTLKANMLTERRRPNARVRIEPADMRGLAETPQPRLGDPIAARDRALILLLATSGVRISEAIHIKVDDIQCRDGHYLIANILGKGASERRIAPLGEEAYIAIQSWLHVRPTQAEWLFTAVTWQENGTLLYTHQPLTRSAAYHTIKRIGAQYGLPSIKPHDLRRFVGTQLAKTDIRQAQRVLGHANLATTAKYYVMDEVPLGTTESLF